MDVSVIHLHVYRTQGVVQAFVPTDQGTARYKTFASSDMEEAIRKAREWATEPGMNPFFRYWVEE